MWQPVDRSGSHSLARSLRSMLPDRQPCSLEPQGRMPNSWGRTAKSGGCGGLLLCRGLRLRRHRVEEGHRRPQLASDLLNEVPALRGAVLFELVAAGAVLLHEFPGKRAVLDLSQQFLHLRAGLVGHDPWAGGVIAELRRIGDGVAHVVK